MTDHAKSDHVRTEHGKSGHGKAEQIGPGPNDLTDEEFEQRHQQRLRQAMDDASLLIAYASESKRGTKPETITELVGLQAVYFKAKKLDSDQEAKFWNAYSTLTSAVVPATVEGIKRGIATKDLGFFDWMLKFPWIALPSVISLILYIFFQIHTVNGADIVKQYRATLQDLGQARTEAVAASAAGTASDRPANTSTDVAVQPNSFQATDKMSLLADQATRYQTLLAEWNSCRIYTLYLDCRQGAEVRGDEEAVRAESELNSLNTSILPLILGLLGACTQVLRAIAKRVIDQSMNTIFLPAYYVRLVLGMILGATIGLFLQPSTPNADNPLSFLASLPLLTASFLAGYAVEIVFALLDKIVGDARSYISGNKSDTGQQPPPPTK